MNAKQLYLENSTIAGVYLCEICRRIYPTQETAEQCCMPYVCDKCGAECDRYRTRCVSCRSKELHDKEAQLFTSAEKLTPEQWLGPVYNGDEYWCDISEFFDCVDPVDQPDYVWACDSTPFVIVSIDNILHNIGENGYEDFDTNMILGLPELKSAIEKFNEANKNIVSWEPNFKKAVVLPKAATTE